MTGPTFFETPAAFRRWLAAHHAKEKELLVGYWKTDSGKASMTWPESVDEALCFGWIDGVRRRLDEARYTTRFTPRGPRSIWSAVNVRNVERLKQEGRMRPAGLAAFEARTTVRSEVYAYENRASAKFAPTDIKRFKAEKEAWAFFVERPASYRTSATWWVVSAKKAQTRERRLVALIADSAAGRTLKHLTRRQAR